MTLTPCCRHGGYLAAARSHQQLMGCPPAAEHNAGENPSQKASCHPVWRVQIRALLQVFLSGIVPSRAISSTFCWTKCQNYGRSGLFLPDNSLLMRTPPKKGLQWVLTSRTGTSCESENQAVVASVFFFWTQSSCRRLGVGASGCSVMTIAVGARRCP